MGDLGLFALLVSPKGQLHGHCVKQHAGLDGPLISSSNDLHMVFKQRPQFIRTLLEKPH